MSRIALITGLTGQDGSYLAELLLTKGYQVVGHVRPNRLVDSKRPNSLDLGASNHLKGQVETVCFSELSADNWESLLSDIEPDEIYHLGASSSVHESWRNPLSVNHANVDFTTVLLQAVTRKSPKSKCFFACSSEVFGLTQASPQSEETPFQPCTPYGVSKAASFWLVQSYRLRYGLFLCNGILFNHESPRRPEHFVSRKVTRAAAKIKLGLQTTLELGDLSTYRDWGYAGDFVDAMWRTLQLPQPEDFVIGTGRLSSTQDLVELAFSQLGLEWQNHVKINPSLVRPNDPKTLVAHIEKARRKLDWVAPTSLNRLVELMVQADMDELTTIAQNQKSAA